MPGLVPRPASQRRSQTPRTRTLAFESANSSTCGDDRPSAARTSSQGRTPVHGRRRAREHPSSSHAHGNGAQARATGTARMDGAPEGGGPPRAAIQRGPCPKVPAEFDRRPLAGARGRLPSSCPIELQTCLGMPRQSRPLCTNRHRSARIQSVHKLEVFGSDKPIPCAHVTRSARFLERFCWFQLQQTRATKKAGFETARKASVPSN